MSISSTSLPSEQPSAAAGPEPRGVRWLVSALVFAVALAVFVRTAPPGLTWAHDSADGGDLITAALVTGVPHPTGYPTFVLLARLFTYLPWGTPAWRVTLLAAVSGALAAALVAATLSLVSQARRRGVSRAAEAQEVRAPGAYADSARWAETMANSLPAALVPLTGGLLLAFTPLLWSQATVAEVYALHAGFAAALLWTVVRWRLSRYWPWAALAGLLFGLALGNHLTSAWLLPLVVAGLACGPQPRRLVGNPPAPATLRRSAGTSRWRILAIFGFALGMGLLVYAYLPLAAAGNPPINWGNPRTASGQWWLVSGQLYRFYVLGVSWQDGLARLQAWAGLLWRDFLPWGVALALGGLGLALTRWRCIVLGGLASLLLVLAWAVSYNTTDSVWTLLPGWVLIALGVGLGLDFLAARLASLGWRGAVLLAILCLAFIVVPLARNWPAQDLQSDRQAEDYLALVLEHIEPGALVITVGDRAIFSLWYGHYGLQLRPDLLVISRDLWGLASYRDTLSRHYPELAAAGPPLELAPLLRTWLAERPVYLAEVDGRAGLTALGLKEDEPYRLEPVEGGGLWQLLAEF